jgi:hypothetical protein
MPLLKASPILRFGVDRGVWASDMGVFPRRAFMRAAISWPSFGRFPSLDQALCPVRGREGLDRDPEALGQARDQFPRIIDRLAGPLAALPSALVTAPNRRLHGM